MNGFCPGKWMRRGLACGIGLVVLAGCGHTQWHFAAVRDVNVLLPSTEPVEPVVKRSGTPAEPLAMSTGGQHCVLMAVQNHDNPDRDADEWGRTYLVVLDGPPVKGKIEVSPANGRLIQDSPCRPARRPYVGLEGYVNILSVNGSKVTAYCVLRSEIIDAYDKPYTLRGFCEFRTASGNEPFLQGRGLEATGPRGTNPK